MSPAPPSILPSPPRQARGWSWMPWLVGAIALAVAAGLFFHFNPAERSIFPKCVFHQMTGLSCPGCGGQRAVHQLLHGNLVGAFRLNPLLVSLLPLGLWMLSREAARCLTGREWPNPLQRPAWGWALAALFIVFWIVRNLPIAPFTWFAI